MTDANVLRTLLARVESASGPDRELDALIHCVVSNGGSGPMITPEEWAEVALRERWNVPPYTASLDAIYSLTARKVSGGKFRGDWDWRDPVDVLARGFCAALLRALIARATSHHPDEGRRDDA